MSEIKRSGEEWSAIKGVCVLDPDGWDRRNFKESWAEMITEAEFTRRLMQSTAGPKPTPALDVAAIRARLEAATPGTWTATEGEFYGIVLTSTWRPELPPAAVAHTGISQMDAEFIAHAPDDIRALLAALAEARKQLADAWAAGVMAKSDSSSIFTVDVLAKNPYRLTPPAETKGN